MLQGSCQSQSPQPPWETGCFLVAIDSLPLVSLILTVKTLFLSAAAQAPFLAAISKMGDSERTILPRIPLFWLRL